MRRAVCPGPAQGIRSGQAAAAAQGHLAGRAPTLRCAAQGVPARLAARLRGGSSPAGRRCAPALLQASRATLDRLLNPARIEHRRRATTRPGTLLRQQIPIRTEWNGGRARLSGNGHGGVVRRHARRPARLDVRRGGGRAPGHPPHQAVSQSSSQWPLSRASSKRVQVTQAGARPKLSGTLASALATRDTPTPPPHCQSANRVPRWLGSSSARRGRQNSFVPAGSLSRLRLGGRAAPRSRATPLVLAHDATDAVATSTHARRAASSLACNASPNVQRCWLA